MLLDSFAASLHDRRSDVTTRLFIAHATLAIDEAAPAHPAQRLRPRLRERSLHPALWRSADPDGLCRESQQIVARAFQIAACDLRQPSRCRPEIALARQAATYLANVAGGVAFRDVARVFGRHPSTVAHACHRIEDLRENLLLDRSLSLLEGALRCTFRLPDLH